MKEKEVEVRDFNHKEEDILDAIGANKRIVNECIGKLARENSSVSETVEYAMERSKSINTIIGVCFEISRMATQTQRLLRAARQFEEEVDEMEEKDRPGMLYG